VDRGGAPCQVGHPDQQWICPALSPTEAQDEWKGARGPPKLVHYLDEDALLKPCIQNIEQSRVASEGAKWFIVVSELTRSWDRSTLSSRRTPRSPEPRANTPNARANSASHASPYTCKRQRIGKFESLTRTRRSWGVQITHHSTRLIFARNLGRIWWRPPRLGVTSGGTQDKNWVRPRHGRKYRTKGQNQGGETVPQQEGQWPIRDYNRRKDIVRCGDN
jgi:hypothetical protein